MDHFIITGTSRGIGKALAEVLLEDENHFVTGVSRSSSINHSRYEHHFIDLSDIQQLIKELDLIYRLKDDFEKIVLVNNAGTLGQVDHVGNLNNEEIEKLFNINVTAPVILMNTFLKHYKESAVEKLIINISSGAGKYPVDGWSGYCSSKAALDMATEVIAKESKISGSNLKCFAVAPGIVDTEMQAEIRQVDPQGFSGKEKFIDYKESGKLADPKEVADKLLTIIKNSGKFNEIHLDVRQM